MQRGLMRVRVVDSSNDAVRVSATAPPSFIGWNGEGDVVIVGRSESEGGEDGSEGVHF